MRVRRESVLLNDAIEALDIRMAEAKRALPKLSIEEQIAYAWKLLSPVELEFVREELDRCITDRVYYLSNYHCIQTEAGIVMCLFPIWDHQHMVEDAVQKEIAATGQARVIVLKPRQAGITEYASGVMCWRTFFLPNAYTISVAQAPDVAGHIQRKVNITYDHLPWWMKPERQYVNRGEYLEFGRKDLAERGTNPGLGSVFVTTHAQRTTGIAIGRTCRSLHMSEVSRWPDGECFSSDIEPSMNAPDTLAIAESTALGEDGFFFSLYAEAAEGDSEWTPVFLPAYRARKFSLPLKPAQIPFKLTELETAIRLRVKAEENFQITDEFFNWRRRRIKSSIKRTGYPYAHYESFPITAAEAFQSSGNAAFPRHKLDEQGQACVRRPAWVGEIIFQGLNAAPKLLLNEVRPEHVLEKREHSNRLYLWERPSPRDVYYLGADCGNGNGPDFSVAEILRAGAGISPDVQVGEWVGFEQPEAFARILYALGSYFNRCEIAVEYAQEGMTTANYLMGELEYPALYRPRNRDRIGKQLASYMHWQTTSKTKPLMMAKMSETLLEDGLVIRSEYLLAELRKAGMSGSAFEGVGSHDDAAVASCISLFCLRETMPEMRLQASYGDGSNQTATVGARASSGAVVYGVYDQFFRLIGQTRSLESAEKTVAANPGFKIKTIPVSKANTAYSVIHHGTGIENEMFREQGMDSADITPNMVSEYRGATGRQQGMFMQPGQGAWRKPPGSTIEGPVQAQLSARVGGGGAAALEAEWLNSMLAGGELTETV